MQATEVPPVSTVVAQPVTPVPTPDMSVTPTPIAWETPTVTPIPENTGEVPCSSCNSYVEVYPPAEPAMPEPVFPETGSSSDDYGYFDALGDVFGWMGHQFVNVLDWLFTESSFVNLVTIYLAIIVIYFIKKSIRLAGELDERNVELSQAQKDQALLKLLDPDDVAEARIVQAFPELKGRVAVDDWDDEGNSLHDPDRGMRPNYV